MGSATRGWIVLVVALTAGCGSKKPSVQADADADGAAPATDGGADATDAPGFELGGPAPPTVVYDGRVVVAPAALLFTKAGETAQLTATATDAAGNPVTGDVTWTSSRPEEITVDATGLVTSVVGVGSAQITAKVGERVSAPIAAIAVAPYAGTTLVTDAQIVANAAPVDPAAPIAPGARLRATLTGVTAPAIGSILVGREGKALAGRVVSVTPSGADQVVELQLIPLLELFERMNVQLRSTVDERSLVAVEATSPTKPVDTDADYGFVKSALAVDSFECQYTVGGESVASRGLSVEPRVRIVPSLEAQADFVKNAEGDWERLHLSLAGSVAATGTLTVKFMPGVSVEARCTMTLLHIPVPIGGPLAFFASFEAPVGLTARIKATLGTSTFEFGGELRATGHLSESATYTPATGTQYARDQGVDFDMRPRYQFPLTLLPFAVKADVSAGAFTGLDARVLASRASLIRANFLGKFAADFALEATQLDVPTYASRYDLKPVLELGPGATAAKALELLGGALPLRPGISIELPEQGSASPRGTLSVDKKELHPGDTAEIKLTLDPKTLEFARIANVQEVRLFRESPGLPRAMVEMEKATPGRGEYTWKWKPIDAEIGKTTFWAMTVSTLGPFIPLEVGDDSRLTVTVLKPGAGGYSYTLDATTDCSQTNGITMETYHQQTHCTGMQALAITRPNGGLDELDDGMSTCTFSDVLTRSSTIAGCTSTTTVENLGSGTGTGMAVVFSGMTIKADSYELSVITGSPKVASKSTTYEEKSGDCATPMPKTATKTAASTIKPYWADGVPDIVKPRDTSTPDVFVGSTTLSMPIPHPCGFVPINPQISSSATAKIDWNLRR
jgi:hypothetical protein